MLGRYHLLSEAAALLMLLLVSSLAALPAFAEGGCAFRHWRDFKGTSIYHHDQEEAYFYVTDHVAIDADGALKAYHPDDVGKHCTKDPHIGLDCPANAGYPKTSWWRKVLVVDPENRRKPYIQTSGPGKGFFLSKTWLTAPGPEATDPNKYVNSMTIPYLVLPGNIYPNLKGTGWKGDVGFAVNLASGNSTPFIVADRGGGAQARLGEGSVALYAALGGKDLNPRTGGGRPDGKNVFVMFPGSRTSVSQVWPRTLEDISVQATSLITAAGGLEAILACAKGKEKREASN